MLQSTCIKITGSGYRLMAFLMIAWKNEVEFRYKVIKLYELKAEEIIRKGLRCLYPFLPLMEGGKDFKDEAEKGIYEGEGSREYKSDLLTGMAIFGGLVSEEIPMKLGASAGSGIIVCCQD